MTVLALETHKVVKGLKAAGFTDEQAEAVTRVMRRAQDIDLTELATKGDMQGVRTELQGLRSELKAEISALRSDLKTDVSGVRSDFQVALAETKADLLKWVIGAIGVQTLVILEPLVTLVCAIPR